MHICFMETNKIEITRGSIEEIDLIKPLWMKLRELHHGLSTHFKTRFENLTWDMRKKALFEKSEMLLLEYAIDSDTTSITGYCISTISEDGKTGEIDSIYVDEKHRGSGIGQRLIENAVAWFDANGVAVQKLSVGVGNEQVLAFYEKFDFFPLHIVLQRK